MRTPQAILDWARRRDLLDVLEDLAKGHHVTPADVVGRARHPRIVRVRDAWLGWLRSEIGMSYPEIGRAMGLDHSTVIQAVRRHAERTQ